MFLISVQQIQKDQLKCELIQNLIFQIENFPRPDFFQFKNSVQQMQYHQIICELFQNLLHIQKQIRSY